ncbi:MAG: hypothetical protein A49_11370 [Methyloceanibacter sp.]|nr:MAG: hypothetical protein A49_11370 [Methyloceanibacter sp.]
MHLQADTPEPRKTADADLQTLERVLYEEGNKPDFEGEMHFIPGVPLISRTPDTLPESQYLTSLILHARHVAEGMLHAPLQQQYVQVTSESNENRNLTGRIKSQVAAVVFQRVFGAGGDLTPPIAGIQGSMKGAGGHHDHDHGDMPHSHSHQHYSPTPVGYSSSLLEVTTGLHALLKVDARLREAQEQRVAITDLIGTSAIVWRVFEHEKVDREHYERFLSRSVPFVAHRRDGDFLVCGYATYKGSTFLMAFDLATIERRVSLGGGGSVTYSEYLKLKQTAAARDPAIGLDPLFWDYTSYFSSRNLDCFLLSPADSVETITALYPIGLDTEKVSQIITDELQKAQVIEQRQQAERLKEKEQSQKEQQGQDEGKERNK